MGFAIERACANECALKKVCSMKDEVPLGDVVYEKDGYAIHKIDGEEHKVWHCITGCSNTGGVKLTCLLAALRAKPLTLRKALPRHQVCLLRRLLIPILPPGPATSCLVFPAKQWRFGITAWPSCGILQQREDELGQQQSSLHPRLPTLATQRSWPTSHGSFIRARSPGRTIWWAREAAQRERTEGISGLLV